MTTATRFRRNREVKRTRNKSIRWRRKLVTRSNDLRRLREAIYDYAISSTQENADIVHALTKHCEKKHGKSVTSKTKEAAFRVLHHD